MPTLASAWPTAVKNHRCMSCGGPISKGVRYYFWKGTSDSGIWTGIATLKECPDCAERYSRPLPAMKVSGPMAERYFAFYTADCPDCGRALHAEVQVLNGPAAGALPPPHLPITCTGQGHAPRVVQTVFVQEEIR